MTTRPSARGRLSPALIYETALGLIDAEGADALSMRRLADELGVNPMAFYKHVDDKEAVLTGVLDLFLERLDIPLENDTTWQDWLRRLAAASRNGFLAHPHLFDLLMARPGRGPIREVYDALIGVMREAGFDSPQIHLAWHALQTHVIGHTYQERAWTAPGDQAAEREQFPHAVGLPHLDGLLAEIGGCNLPEQFQAGLDLLIAGLELCLDASRP